MTGSGRNWLRKASRPVAAGVAPEKSSTAPAMNANVAMSLGATVIVNSPTAMPHWRIACRRWYVLVEHQHDEREQEAAARSR